MKIENNYPIAKLMNCEIPSLSTVDVSTYDDEFDAQTALANLMSADGAVAISTMINKEIELDEVAFLPTAVNGDNGEVYNSVRTIVATKDGEVFATNSKVFAESVAMILNICGAPRSWVKPRYFKVQQIDLANARRCYKLVIVKK